jgi:hypothetical protein
MGQSQTIFCYHFWGESPIHKPFINLLCCSHWASGFEAIGNAYPSFQSPRKYLSPGLFGPCGALEPLEPLERGTLEGLSSRNFDLKCVDEIHWNS